MPGVGVGGLFANLFNPGLDQSLAAGITPDPRPLAQQPPGGPGAPGQGGGGPQGSNAAQQPNLAPAAITAPDPVTAQYNAALTANADRLRASRLDALSADLNRNIEGVAAGFGTAEQQAAKQRALAGGTVGDSLGALAKSQAIGDQNVTDSEHARYMGNAAILAKSLGLPVDQTTELMNGPPELIQKAFGTVQANQTKTEAVKNWEQARAAMRAAGKTDAEINAALPPELLALGGSGTNLDETQYYQEKAFAVSQGKGADFPDYQTWKANHAQAAKETEDAHKVALQLPGLKSQLTTMAQTADSINPDDIKGIFGNLSKQDAARQIFNYDPSKGGMDPATLYGDGRTLSAAETNAVIAARKLHLANYAANFKEAGSGQRLSQAEATRLGAASDTLGTFSGSVDDYMGRVNDVKNKISHSMANAHGEARDLDSLPVQYRAKIDPSFLEGPNALKNLPTWARPVSVTSKADIDALADGQAYKPTSGQYAGKILFKGQEAGYEDY